MADDRGITLVGLPSGTEFRDVFVRELERLGHKVVAAPDWEFALEASNGRPPRAVVFDPGQSPGDGLGWPEGLAALRERQYELVAVALVGRDSSTKRKRKRIDPSAFGGGHE